MCKVQLYSTCTVPVVQYWLYSTGCTVPYCITLISFLVGAHVDGPQGFCYLVFSEINKALSDLFHMSKCCQSSVIEFGRETDLYMYCNAWPARSTENLNSFADSLTSAEICVLKELLTDGPYTLLQ